MLEGFEKALMFVLNLAGLHFETTRFESSIGSDHRVFKVNVSSLEETWAWAKKTCALARIHCFSPNLAISIEMENGLGEKQEMWFRRWNHSQFSNKWEPVTYEFNESYVWVTAEDGVTYGIYFKVNP